MKSGNMALAVGAICGAALAVSGLMQPGEVHMGDAVARINGVDIPRAEFTRVLRGASADRQPGDASIRRRVLQRLIDEELLVQHALRSGLGAHDPRVRADLSASVIANVNAQSATEPSEDALEAFYQASHDRFSPAPRVRARQFYFPVGDDDAAARRRAQRAQSHLRENGSTPDSGGRAPVPLPDVALPAAKLLDYLGPTVTRAALGLDANEVSEPLRSAHGYHVVHVLERHQPAAPTFEEIRSQVRAQWLREQSEQRLRALVQTLRAGATIEIADDA